MLACMYVYKWMIELGLAKLTQHTLLPAYLSINHHPCMIAPLLYSVGQIR